jgi:acyl dehydratase
MDGAGRTEFHMPFPADQVGLRLQPFEKTLSVRDILAYAAGLGACEPAFLDDARAGGLRALPFQCVSLEWPCVLSVREALSARLSPEEARRGVHAVQDSTFHRPMRPGDRLVTDGRIVSARRIRSGVLIVCRLETRDLADGEAVTTSWTSSIYRGVDLEGEAVTLDAPTAPASTSGPLPADAPSVRISIPREMAHVYSECADIWNPIHTERAVALAAGLPDIILHGTATWALAGLTLLRRLAGGEVGRLRRISGRFTGMVIPGEEILVRYAPGDGAPARFEVLTTGGKPAISDGAAWVASDPSPQRGAQL